MDIVVEEQSGEMHFLTNCHEDFMINSYFCRR